MLHIVLALKLLDPISSNVIQKLL